MPTAASVTPFYLDWTFWSWVVALLALVLSQIPPLRVLIRRPRLQMRVHTRIHLTHTLGFPNSDLYLSIRNTGGRPADIESIQIDFFREGVLVTSLPGQAYFEEITAANPTMLVPFRLEAGSHWGHVVRFHLILSRLDDKHVNQLRQKVRDDVLAKVNAAKAAGEPEQLRSDPSAVREELHVVAGRL